jgi:hypothetical protein
LKSKAINKDLFRDLPPEWPEDPSLIREQVGASERKVVVLDDDPTGTQTVHNTPVLTEWSVEALAAELQKDYPAFYILTNSRRLALPAARSLNEEIGRCLVSRQESRPRFCRGAAATPPTGCFPGEVEALASGRKELRRLDCIPFSWKGSFTPSVTHYVEEKGWLVPAAETGCP